MIKRNMKKSSKSSSRGEKEKKGKTISPKVEKGGVKKPSIGKMLTGLAEEIMSIDELLDVPMFVPSYKNSVMKSAYSSAKATP